MSFWYGLSFEDAVSMPMASLEVYLDRLPARMAEWKMVMADPIALPHMKVSDQRAMMERWESALRSAMPARKPVPAKLRMMGIGVRFVGIQNAEGGLQNGASTTPSAPLSEE